MNPTETIFGERPIGVREAEQIDEIQAQPMAHAFALPVGRGLLRAGVDAGVVPVNKNIAHVWLRRGCVGSCVSESPIIAPKPKLLHFFSPTHFGRQFRPKKNYGHRGNTVIAETTVIAEITVIAEFSFRASGMKMSATSAERRA